MTYHTLEEWQTLITEDARLPKAADSSWVLFAEILCDFEELGYPDDTQCGDPLLQVFKAWVLRRRLDFAHEWLVNMQYFRDGDHYQRVGDSTVRLAEILKLPRIHPGYIPTLVCADTAIMAFQVVQRLATWQTPEVHRAWLHQYPFVWLVHATEFGVTTAWPVFLHYLEWGVAPGIKPPAAQALLTPELRLRWLGLSAEPTFVLWGFLQQMPGSVVTPMTWHDWVSTLPPEHAAHTLDGPRAVQAYTLWATLQTPGHPPNWLALLQMLEPALDVVPTGEGPVADPSPIDFTL